MFSGGSTSSNCLVYKPSKHGASVSEQEFRRLQEVILQIVRTAGVYWVWNCGIPSDQPFFKCFYSNFHNVIRFLNSTEIRVKLSWMNN